MRRIQGGLSVILLLLIGIAGGILLALSPDLALPVAALFLPGLAAFALDQSPGWAIARAILLFQAAASIHPLADAWYRCAGVESCVTYLAQWRLVLVVWLAGAAALALAHLLPLALKLLDDRKTAQRRTTLTARRQSLADEWGLR